MDNGLWTVLYGDIVCDVTEWSNIHPGGYNLIKLISGREGTVLIESYHPYASYAAVINKLNDIPIVGIFTPNDKERLLPIINQYPKCGKSKFYVTLSKRINDYFKRNNINYYGNPLYNISDCVITMTLWILFLILSWYHYDYYIEYVIIVICGMLCARIGLLMHTANHRAICQYQWINDIISNYMFIIGNDKNMWIIKHQILHHIAPNIIGIDDDIADVDILRMHPLDGKKHKWYYKYQHIYLNYCKFAVLQICIQYIHHQQQLLPINFHLNFANLFEHILFHYISYLII
eukprot:51545_1